MYNRCTGAGVGHCQRGTNQPTPGTNGVVKTPAQLGRYSEPSLGRWADNVTEPPLPGTETLTVLYRW
jgi:hypothetical protein